MSKNEKTIYNKLTAQFLTSEAFYVKPINFNNKTLDDIILLEEDIVKEGINKLAVCV